MQLQVIASVAITVCCTCFRCYKNKGAYQTLVAFFVTHFTQVLTEYIYVGYVLVEYSYFWYNPFKYSAVVLIGSIHSYENGGRHAKG